MISDALWVSVGPSIVIATKWVFDTIDKRAQRRDIQAVRAELSANGGQSVKDKTDEGAKDSKDTLQVVTEIRKELETSRGADKKNREDIALLMSTYVRRDEHEKKWASDNERFKAIENRVEILEAVGK